jgi:hypothetical protein
VTLDRSLIFRAFAWTSLVLWAAALCFPTYITPIENDPHNLSNVWGVEALALGWAGYEEDKWGWFANPLWLMAMISLFRGRRPLLLPMLVAAPLALSAMFPTHIDFGDDHGVNGDSAVGIGAWVWFAAIAVTFIAAWLGFFERVVATLRAPPAPAT